MMVLAASNNSQSNNGEMVYGQKAGRAALSRATGALDNKRRRENRYRSLMNDNQRCSPEDVVPCGFNAALKVPLMSAAMSVVFGESRFW